MISDGHWPFMNNERLCDHTLFMRSILVIALCSRVADDIKSTKDVSSIAHRTELPANCEESQAKTWKQKTSVATGFWSWGGSNHSGFSTHKTSCWSTGKNTSLPEQETKSWGLVGQCAEYFKTEYTQGNRTRNIREHWCARRINLWLQTRTESCNLRSSTKTQTEAQSRSFDNKVWSQCCGFGEEPTKRTLLASARVSHKIMAS